MNVVHKKRMSLKWSVRKGQACMYGMVWCIRLKRQVVFEPPNPSSNGFSSVAIKKQAPLTKVDSSSN